VSKVDWRNLKLTSLRAGGSAQSSKEPARVRTEFPETWLWSESSAGYQPSDTFCYLCCKASVTQPVHLPQSYIRSYLRCFDGIIYPKFEDFYVSDSTSNDYVARFLSVLVCVESQLAECGDHTIV